MKDYREGTVQIRQGDISEACNSAQADDCKKKKDIINRELIEDAGSDICASYICDYGEAEESQCDSLDRNSVERLTVRRNTHSIRRD